MALEYIFVISYNTYWILNAYRALTGHSFVSQALPSSQYSPSHQCLPSDRGEQSSQCLLSDRGEQSSQYLPSDQGEQSSQCLPSVQGKERIQFLPSEGMDRAYTSTECMSIPSNAVDTESVQ